MAEPSKILTVSYGTFSCTLEGFDDAFETMKAIAEYFRDLAAEDRYFGAEPPTPDPEMLARIAERDIERRVEARLSESGYVLRPAALAGAAAATSDSSVADLGDGKPVEGPASVTRDTASAPDDEEDAAATPEAAEETAPEDATAEDIAAEETAPEAEVAGDTAADEAAPEAEVAEDIAAEETAPEAEVAENIAAEETAPEAEVAGDIAAEETAPEAEVAGDTAAEPETAGADAGQAGDGPSVAADDAPQKGDVAADYDPDEDKRPWSELTMTERRLRRQARRARRAEEEAKAAEEEAKAPKPAALTETREINQRRGLIRRFSEAGKSSVAATAPAAASAVTTEDLKAPEAAEEPQQADEPAQHLPASDVVADAAADPAETAADDAETASDAEELAEAPKARAAGESVAAKLARIRAVVGGRETRETAGSETEDDSDAVAGDSAEATTAEVPADVSGGGAEAEVWSQAQVDAETGEDSTEAAPHVAEAMDPQDDAATADEAADEASDEAPGPSRVRARVVRMRRSDYDAQAAGSAERPADADAQTGAVDDEAALDEIAAAEDLDDLAALDELPDAAEISDGGLDGEDSTLSPEDEAALLEELAEVERLARADTAAAEPTGRAALLARSPDADTDAVDRILTETDAQLKEPEGNRRREAIAHLKAAVAATEAARQLGEDDGLDDGENMFREDLDQVVRPRRTARPESRSDRPRPAPLKLVASQRVDAAPPAAPADPVMPRRVQAGAGAETSAEDQDSHGEFASFAAEMGASGLADLLEAAAAHAAFVEGEEDVSRPQLMKMVTAIMPGGFSREDGLRAFGTLLRQGRIEKVRNGRFRISPQTRFNPKRAASGV